MTLFKIIILYKVINFLQLPKQNRLWQYLIHLMEFFLDES